MERAERMNERCVWRSASVISLFVVCGGLEVEEVGGSIFWISFLEEENCQDGWMII